LGAGQVRARSGEQCREPGRLACSIRFHPPPATDQSLSAERPLLLQLRSSPISPINTTLENRFSNLKVAWPSLHCMHAACQTGSRSGTLRQMGSEQPSMPTSSRLVNAKQGRPMPTGHPYRSTQDAAVSFLVPDRAPRSPSPSRRKHQPDRSQYAATSLGIARAGPRRIDDARAQRRYCLSRPEWSWTGPRGALPSRGAISMGSGRARVPIAIMPGRAGLGGLPGDAGVGSFGLAASACTLSPSC